MRVIGASDRAALNMKGTTQHSRPRAQPPLASKGMTFFQGCIMATQRGCRGEMRLIKCVLRKKTK